MILENRQNPATQAKKRWNSSRYTQINVAVDPAVAAAFKVACADVGVSMAGVLSQFMAEFSNTEIKRKPSLGYSTRRKRRAAAHTVAQQMEAIRAAEESQMDKIPENLHGSEGYEKTAEIVSSLEEAIEMWESIYY